MDGWVWSEGGEGGADDVDVRGGFESRFWDMRRGCMVRRVGRGGRGRYRPG